MKKSKKLKPVFYTDVEGGNWLVWKAGKINSLPDPGQQLVEINGITVHSLTFDSDAIWGGNPPRWDSINGWTKRIE